MKIADVMTRGVVSVAPDKSMREAALLMLQYDVSGFPVVDHGKLVGMVTEGDFLSRVETGTESGETRRTEPITDPGLLAARYAHSHGRKVGDVMSKNVVTVAEDASLEDAVRLMERHRIKRLPVVRGGAMVGIITRADILHAFIVGSPKPVAAVVSDGGIREQLMAELAKQTWAPQRSVNVVVENGAVEFQGVVRDERQRVALRIIGENTPGVKAVRDNLRILDPGAIK
jgi:CBS domain-containing protein